MAHYVASDIHGEYDRFVNILQKTDFCKEDIMYVLGDVIDRGPDGIKVLEMIMKAPNIHMILGNHEYMFLTYLLGGKSGKYAEMLDMNGNRPTMQAYLQLNYERQRAITEFLQTRPTHMEVTIENKRFYLVHAFPGNTIKEKLWTRPDINTSNPISGCQLIIGHTPVLFLGRSREEEKTYIKKLEATGEHLQIYHGKDFIDIDCGCGHDISVRALGCIRLEDMQEFYA